MPIPLLSSSCRRKPAAVSEVGLRSRRQGGPETELARSRRDRGGLTTHLVLLSVGGLRCGWRDSNPHSPVSETGASAELRHIRIVPAAPSPGRFGEGASNAVHAASGRSDRRMRRFSRRASRRTRSSITLAEYFSLGCGSGLTGRTRYRRCILVSFRL